MIVHTCFLFSPFFINIFTNENSKFQLFITIHGILYYSLHIKKIMYAFLNKLECYSHMLQEIKKQEKQEQQEDKSICYQNPIILVVIGYRENVVYWNQCLESVCNLSTCCLEKIYIIIDGNVSEDFYMYEISVFWKRKSILPFQIIPLEHGGKRKAIHHAIETCYRDICNTNKNPKDYFIAFTDSDTILETNSIHALGVCMRNEGVTSCGVPTGCATGSLRIFNSSSSWICKMMDSRYLYAFGIERASQSFWGCMTCCSGPLSIYRLHSFFESDQLLHRFNNQLFMGKKAETGDDRHMTNLFMQKGYLSRHNGYAVAHTECPPTLRRFLLQQLRWSRSFYREIFWMIRCLRSQSSYLSFVFIQELFYPFLFSFFFIIVLYGGFSYSGYLLFSLLLSSFLISITNVLFLYILSHDKKSLYHFFYFPFYLCLLFPLKCLAVVTPNSTGWLTSIRYQKRMITFLSTDIQDNIVIRDYMDLEFITLFIITWNSILLGGFISVFLRYF